MKLCESCLLFFSSLEPFVYAVVCVLRYTKHNELSDAKSHYAICSIETVRNGHQAFHRMHEFNGKYVPAVAAATELADDVKIVSNDIWWLFNLTIVYINK